MIEEGRIGTPEAVAATTYLLGAKLFISFPQQMAIVGLTAAWMVPVISFAVGCLGFLVIAALLGRHPGMDIVQASEEVAGPVLGFVASLGYFAFFLAATILVMREFSETAGTALLPLTPLSVTVAVFAAAATFAAYLGVESLARAAFLAAPVIGATLILLNLLLLSQCNFDALFPLFGPGPAELFFHAASHSAITGDVLFLGLIAGQLREPLKLRSAGLAAIGIACALTTVSMLAFAATFPYPLSAHVPYPGYEATRLIYLGRFFQRVEVAFIFLWVISGCVQLALGMYAATMTLARMLKSPVYRPLLPSIAVIGYTLAFVPADFPTATRLDFELVRTYGAFAVFVTPAVLLLIAQLRAGRGAVRRSGP